MRSHLLEGKVRHRRSRPFVYALEHERLLRRAGPRRARRRRPVAAARSGATARTCWSSGTRTTGRSRRRTSAPTVLAHLRAEGEDPTGWRITLVTNLRVLGYVFNPASFYPVPGRRGHPARGRDRGAQHAPRAPPLHAPAGAARAAPTSVSGDGEGLLRVAVHRHGGPVHGARAGRARPRLRIAINERQDGEPLLSTSLVLERRRLTNRNRPAHAAPLPVRDPQDHRP